MGKYFGTDGIRGLANRDITAELALRLGAAAGEVLLSRPHGMSVLIGRDPRISGDMLESALAAGFASRGADVVLVGVIPTPGVSYLVRETSADVGCVISASHNSLEYNGIKLFGSDGEKLPDATEASIEERLEPHAAPPPPIGGSVGRFYREPELVRQYEEHLKAACGVSLEGMKLVVDAANGAAWHIAPRVLRELGAEVVCINCSPDGENINLNCGSLHPEQMLSAVRECGADAGLAFDGDADRMIMGTSQGVQVDGDAIMAICGVNAARRGELPGGRVVATVMSNVGLERALEQHDLVLDRVEEVGDRFVARRMRETGAAIGGEKSGHIIFSRFSPTGDGLLTALQVLRVMVQTERPLAELADVMQELPQVLEGVRVPTRTGWQADAYIQRAIRLAQERLEGSGRVHVRASGTEPLIRVMAEGPDVKELQEIVEEVCSAIRERMVAA